VLDRSFTELQFTLDPLAATSRSYRRTASPAGVADKETSLKGFIDVTALNGVLTQAGKPAVDAAGLDKAQG
jgi:NitT/TauT family transport system substrate-binding protein